MQPGRPGFQQLFAHFGDHFLTELADAVGVVTVSFQLLADPARNFRSTHIREPHQAGEVDDGHDARHHRNGDAHLLQAVDEVEVTVGEIGRASCRGSVWLAVGWRLGYTYV